MNKKFFIPLIPSVSETTKRGQPTHYARNNGIQKLDWRLAAHIANEWNQGNIEPELFFCGWDSADGIRNVGIEVPREKSRPKKLRAVAEVDIKVCKGLEDLFE